MQKVKLKARCHVSRGWNDYMEWEVDSFSDIDQCIHSAELELLCCDHTSDMMIVKITEEVLKETKKPNNNNSQQKT